ncbi:hypothetical protein [Streptomyces lichenis]|uniref:Uncharacterized protein n=1 Tax=Streptomyces lichenis TaxID=2306967 RepID=A0ABT0I5Z7_9ACTN|nr:hypothetical protein [Streptomyces lichenis]MCK8676744.1 hypothetical protein [Streptomyces lichenis]
MRARPGGGAAGGGRRGGGSGGGDTAGVPRPRRADGQERGQAGVPGLATARGRLLAPAADGTLIAFGKA